MSKIYFQGTFGAYSHLAALSVDPKAEMYKLPAMYVGCYAEKDAQLTY